MGIIKGFYFRALRDCIPPKVLDNEFDYIENSFMRLQYPKYSIQRTKKKKKKKAVKIHKCKYSPYFQNNFSNNNTL